ncbi:fibrillarin-like rRNA/tRNA 2'-O-methyltransferase [Methanogenium organophilum]|uniref:Fibrillarin-like rRNA/tRNA 2'-O-methyltransferase n=1 Tax=Methanogenium organophilum TaxID=2199 RepID=A0A9X9S548_METOG|nr:fibrillarin-like rRNA/tRNA 2'-O-methyltransferase [Methanogenium organophilum]WAI01907.1 fibrillarin-like rRNA/tRNA 2'-O-methyltransferase [Methanogenium organophilum]
MKVIRGTIVSEGEGGVYGERMMNGCRVWDPHRSKLPAAILNGAPLDLTADMRVLYMGAANGTTVSHVADYVETIYAIEFAPRPMQDLIEVARRRPNIVPIMADVNRPEVYGCFVELVDMIYQDVAQPNQADILRKNLPFLKDGGIAVLMLKARSVDVRKPTEEIAEETCAALREMGLTILWTGTLNPYHRDHMAILCMKE